MTHKETQNRLVFLKSLKYRNPSYYQAWESSVDRAIASLQWRVDHPFQFKLKSLATQGLQKLIEVLQRIIEWIWSNES